MQRPQQAGFYRFRIGNLTLIALHDGVVSRERASNFISNVPNEEVSRAMLGSVCRLRRSRLLSPR